MLRPNSGCALQQHAMHQQGSRELPNTQACMPTVCSHAAAAAPPNTSTSRHHFATACCRLLPACLLLLLSTHTHHQILYSVDPEATPLGLDSLSTINPDVLPEDLRQAVESIEVYGPQVCVACCM